MWVWLAGLQLRVCCLCKCGGSSPGTRLAGLCLLLVLGSEASAARPHDISFEFDIPQQDLNTALEAVALQSGVRLFYRTEVVQGITSPSLKVHDTVERAISALLAGTNLTFEITPSDVVLVRRKEEDVLHGDSRPALAETQTPAERTVPSVDAIVPVPAAPRTIEEVQVTARRREESLQEVPLTISAFSGDRLEYSGIDNALELALLIPNVSISGGGSTSGMSVGAFRIRGVPGVARYLDGIYLRNARGSLQSLIELDRVEVLRGPQGTLFGKDAIGGAIQYISKAPASEFGARVRTTLGTNDRVEVVANVDVPLSENLLTKLMVANLHTGGYVDSTTIDRSFGGSDEQQFRAALLWKASEAVTVQMSGLHTRMKDNGEPQVLFAVTPQVSAGIPNDPYLYNYVDANIRDLGLPVDNVSLPGRWKTRSSQPWSSQENMTLTLIGSVDWTMGDGWALKWLSGYRELEGFHYGDTDATEYIIFESWRPMQADEFSQEFQLTRSTDRFDWIFGLYYESSDVTSGNWRYQNVEIREPAILAALQAAFPGINPPGSRNSQTRTQDIAKALFTEGTWNFSDQLALTLGIRYSQDKTTPSAERPCTGTVVPGVFPRDRLCATEVLFRETGNFPRVTPRVSVKYQWTPNLMTYFTWSQGFDGGGINTTADMRDPVLLPDGGYFPYGPQVLSNFEAGLRSDLFNGRLRLNSSIFHGEWRDIQVMEELIPGQPGRWTTNAGAAQIEGIELEATRLIGESLRLNAAVAWLDTRYTDLGLTTQLTLDTPFPFSPEWSFTLGGEYGVVLSSGAELLFRSEYGWQDAMWTNQDDASRIELPAYGLLSSGMTYKPTHGSWDLSITGTNLLNEYYRMSGFRLPTPRLDFGTVAPPREFRLAFRFSFR